MNPLAFIILFIIFVLVFLISFVITWRASNLAIEKRLARIKKQTIQYGLSRANENSSFTKSLTASLIKLSMPEGQWESSPIRMQFLKAGYRNEEVVLSYYALKTLFSIGLLLISVTYCYVVGTDYAFSTIVSVGLVFFAVGYYLPNLWLYYRTKNRREQIFNTFPDALDLMRICVSSGLGLDAAIARVGKELSIASSALSGEFHQLSLELRAGSSREHALKNLAARTGVEDIQSLVSMLIQSERFGTSVSDSLRLHSEGLRGKRKLKAQEKAAKIPAKLSIPMILCIFPALFVVILGPSIVSVLRMLDPIMRSQ